MSKISPSKPIESLGKANGKHAHSSGKAAANGGRKAEARSRVTNGQDVLPGVDNRSMIARRFFDIQTALVIDLGGANQISEARLQLIRRFAASACLAEAMEAKRANGEDINITEHGLLCSTMVRVANKIGINRIPKTVTDLDTFLEARERAKRPRPASEPVSE